MVPCNSRKPHLSIEGVYVYVWLYPGASYIHVHVYTLVQSSKRAPRLRPHEIEDMDSVTIIIYKGVSALDRVLHTSTCPF